MILARPRPDCSEEVYAAWILQPREGGDMAGSERPRKSWAEPWTEEDYRAFLLDELEAIEETPPPAPEREPVEVHPSGFPMWMFRIPGLDTGRD